MESGFARSARGLPSSAQRTNPASSVRILFIQFSGLLAALTFADQFFAGASAGHAVSTAVISALVVYAVLVAGDLLVQRLLELAEPSSHEPPSVDSAPAAHDQPGALAA